MATAHSILLEETISPPGYCVERELSPHMSYLAVAPTGRHVVLKRADEDCLVSSEGGAQLHPMIRDRLGRVRELAHFGVANLYTVERAGDGAYLVWEFVEGQTLEELIAHRGSASSIPRSVAYELAVAVESLHALGLIHGALHARNVIITPCGSLRLTHVSPLLYTEAQVDVDATVELLHQLGCGDVLGDDQALSLREIACRLAAWSRADVPSPQNRVMDRAGRGIRRRSLGAAALVGCMGFALSAGVWGLASRQTSESSLRNQNQRLAQPRQDAGAIANHPGIGR